MKFNDAETQSIANAVSDVLEGKVKKEGYGKKKIKSGYGEEKEVREMDPKKHVKKDEGTGMYCVYNSKGDKVKQFKSKEEAEKYATDNHDDLMVEGPEEPRAKGEKEFKDKHVVKKSGENPDGTVTKEDSKRQLTDEQKYKEFFASALKKYGVKSPQELDKEKRKEFFNYVDKNYKATNEAVNEVLGNVKKAAKSALDKINPKKRAEKREKIADIKKEILRLKKLDQQHQKNLDKKEAEFKAGKIDKERMDQADDYHTSAMHTHGQKVAELEDQLKKLMGESVTEATLKVDGFTGKTDDGENKDSVNEPKNKGLRGRIKIMSKGSSQYGGVKAVMTGSEEDLISYAKMHLGADSDAKTLADVQKDIL